LINSKNKFLLFFPKYVSPTVIPHLCFWKLYSLNCLGQNSRIYLDSSISFRICVQSGRKSCLLKYTEPCHLPHQCSDSRCHPL
jgi:hypothetical protein